jgi:hypothetical protein
MFALQRLRLPPVLRMLMLGLLLLGLLVKPILAVACEIGDAQQTLAAELEPATQAPDTGASDDCCLAHSCYECCAHTVALVPPATVAATNQVSASPPPRLSVKFEPPGYPVGFRPPIAS